MATGARSSPLSIAGLTITACPAPSGILCRKMNRRPDCWRRWPTHERHYPVHGWNSGNCGMVALAARLAAKPCAVLGPPDGQELYDQWEAYDGFVESADTLMIADAPEEGPAWMLSLENRWFQCMVRHLGGPLWMTDATDGIRAGMSTRPNGLSNGLSRRRSARVLTTFAR